MKKNHAKKEGPISRFLYRRRLKPRKWKPVYRISQFDVREIYLEAEHDKAEKERIAKLIAARESKNSQK